MSTELRGEEALEKARKLMSDLDVCMLTTKSIVGNLHSRPMSTNGCLEADGSIWFFTTDDSLKVLEVENSPRVNVSFASKEDGAYLSLSGTALISKDRTRMKQLWKPILKAWFPEGVEQANLALLKVDCDKIEFWDAPGNFISHAVGLSKALLSGTTYEPGEHGVAGQPI
jgi:general stress protein 26